MTGAAGAQEAVEVRMVRDDSTGVELPRITLAGRPEVEARVNASLDSLSASLACNADISRPGTDPFEYDTAARVDHAADDVLSVNIHSSYNCGGPYPSSGVNQSVTYDLTTGEAVPFDALFRDDADRSALAGLLSAALTPMAGDMNGDCDEVLSTEALSDGSFDYSLNDEGIAVQPDFPHVIADCGVEATLPYASVRAFARDGGVLARVADAAR
jgi:hypothetical protein